MNFYIFKTILDRSCIEIITYFKTPLNEKPTQIWRKDARKKGQKKAPEILMGHNGYHQVSCKFWISYIFLY